MLRVLAVVAMLLTSFSHGADEFALRDQVYDFLKANVMKRPLVRQSTGTNADKTLEFEFERTLIHTDLVKTERGLTFNQIMNIKQRNYDLDKDGKRTAAPAKVEDRMLVAEFALIQMRSAPLLLGSQVIPANSWGDSTGSSLALRATMEQGALKIVSKSPDFADFFGAGGTSKPGISGSEAIYNLGSDGKLIMSETTTSTFVDAETMKPVSDPKVSTFESKQP